VRSGNPCSVWAVIDSNVTLRFKDLAAHGSTTSVTWALTADLHPALRRKFTSSVVDFQLQLVSTNSSKEQRHSLGIMDQAGKAVSELMANPINVGLVGLIGFLVYKIFRGRAEPAGPMPEPRLPPLKKQDFTMEQLREFDGTGPEGRVLMAVNGRVFDVTRGKNFYGPSKLELKHKNKINFNNQFDFNQFDFEYDFNFESSQFNKRYLFQFIHTHFMI